LNAAVAGMAADGTAIVQSAQSLANHHQQLSHEVALAVNFPVNQIQQELAAIPATLQTTQDVASARYVKPLFLFTYRK
jgi:hypothetical protein